MLSRILFILVAVYSVSPAKILGIFPTPSYSHFTLGFRLLEELAMRGHDVTVVNPFPQKTKIENYTDVSVESLNEVLTEFKNEFYNRDKMGTITGIKFVHQMAHRLTEELLAHENFQKLLKSQQKYDLIIMEYFLNDALMGVGNIFNAPIVLSSTLPSSTFINHLAANPAPSAYVPNILSPFTGNMDFWQRFSNLAYNSFDTIYKEFCMLPLHDQLLKKYISENLNIENVMQNASLILLNSHPSFSEAVPHTANMIEVGGYHIRPPKNLSGDLLELMNNAEEGVVLFSMGSNLKSSQLDEKKRRALVEAFGRIKQKVIWKFEDNKVENLPDNVRIMEWLPQQDILAHPNTKAFISHGGMLSTIEAVYFGIPVIGIPIYGDQKMNIAKAVQNGYALSVPFQQLDEDNLLTALKQILNDPKYRNNAKARSQIMNDQVVQPLDSAIFWIEYVIRHKGADHFQSAGVHLKWYKRNIIDIIIVLAIIEIVLFLIFYYIIKHIIHVIGRKLRERRYYNNESSRNYLRLGNEK